MIEEAYGIRIIDVEAREEEARRAEYAAVIAAITDYVAATVR